MRKNIKQLRAISYAYTEKKRKQAEAICEKLEKMGIKVEKNKYAAITLRRAYSLMSEV